MTGPEPLDDRDLDRLLSRGTVPAASAGLTDRIVAEARRPDRVPAPAARPVARRSSHRPWSRTMIAGVIAINLFAASAIAAAFGGHEGFRRVSALSAQVVHAIAAVIPHRHPVEVHPVAHRVPAEIKRPQSDVLVSRPVVVVPPVSASPPREIVAPRIVDHPIAARKLRREQRVRSEQGINRSVVQHTRRGDIARFSRPGLGRGNVDHPGALDRRLRNGTIYPTDHRAVEPLVRERKPDPTGRGDIVPKAREEPPAVEQRRGTSDANESSDVRDRGEERSSQPGWRRGDQSGPRNRRNGLGRRRGRR